MIWRLTWLHSVQCTVYSVLVQHIASDVCRYSKAHSPRRFETFTYRTHTNTRPRASNTSNTSNTPQSCSLPGSPTERDVMPSCRTVLAGGGDGGGGGGADEGTSSDVRHNTFFESNWNTIHWNWTEFNVTRTNWIQIGLIVS